MTPIDKVTIALGDRVVRRTATGARARCPGHDDQNPSLSVTVADDGRVLLNCFAGCATAAVLGALGLEFVELFPAAADPRPAIRTSPPAWSPGDARRVWVLAHGRVRDDASLSRDHDAYRYLTSRGLACGWEEGAFGILHEDLEPRLPGTVGWWPRRGYRVILPLVDKTGCVVEVQARSIDPAARRKTLFPKGGSGRGCMFASTAARELLVDCSEQRVVIFGEGLTDHLALTIASPVPVISAAGVGVARHAIGSWVRGRHVVIALDCDEAGERHVQDVADEIYRAGGRASRLRWPPPFKDACDMLAADDEAFMRFLDEALAEVTTWEMAAAR